MNLQHPSDTNMIWEFDLYKHKWSMYRRLAVLRSENVIRIVGCIPNEGDCGRPLDVYAVEPWKADNMQHEVKLSRVLLHWEIPALRGRHVDSKLRPDATLLWVKPVHIELDTGSMNWNRVESRMKKYQGRQDFVIFITSSALRVPRVLSRCDFLGNTLLACSYEEALNGAELTDCKGAKVLLVNLLKNLRNNQQGESE